MTDILTKLLILLCFTFAATSASAQSFETDENGRQYQTRFSLQDRLYLAHQIVNSQGQTLTKFETGVDFEFGLSYPKEQVWWMLRHRLLKFNASTAIKNSDSLNLGFGLISGDYLRHDLSSFVLIPGDLDLKIPAAFDIGVMYRLGIVAAQVNDRDWRWTKFDIVDLSVLMDFIRDQSYRHRFGVGFSGSYTVDRQDEDFVHRVIPFSMVRARYGFDSKSGLFSVEAIVDGGYGFQAIYGDPLKGDIRIKGRGEVTWVPFAVNDRPVRLIARSEFDWVSARMGSPSMRWTSSIGLQLDFGY